MYLYLSVFTCHKKEPFPRLRDFANRGQRTEVRTVRVAVVLSFVFRRFAEFWANFVSKVSNFEEFLINMSSKDVSHNSIFI